MSKRTRAQSITDDLAFPVRVKIAVPGSGLGTTMDRMAAWLATELGPGRYACHGTQSIGTDAAALYFLSIGDAQRFAVAFPDAPLADGTRSKGYTAPGLSARSR